MAPQLYKMTHPFECKVCGATRIRKLYEVEKFIVVKCGDCNHIQVKNVPTAKELSEYYARGFGLSSQINEGNVVSVARECTGEWPLQVAKELGIESNATIVDVGCSIGYDLFAFRERGKFSNVYGVEISDQARALGGRVLDLQLFKTLSHLTKEVPMIDFAYLKHNLEHQVDPAEVIRELYDVLSPGGYLLLGIPHVHSMNGLWGRYWEWMTPPVHLHFFCKKSLRALVEGTGFETVYFRGKRGHGQPFLRHLFYFAPLFRKLLRSRNWQPYDPPNRFGRKRRIIERTLTILGAPVTLLQHLAARLQLGEELWLLLKKPVGAK